MRLFVAATLPQGLIDALSETSALLRQTVRGRYVASDLFHVTLAFLGEVPAYQVPDVEQALEAATADFTSFQTMLGELGTFGRASNAILWQGFQQGRKEWVALAGDVRRCLGDAGFALDGKGFLPHVTLMRRADVSRGVLPMPCVRQGVIDAVTLYSSDLSGDRPQYEALAQWGTV